MGGDSKFAHAPSTILMESYLQEHRVDLSGEKLTYSWPKKRFIRGDLQNDKKTAVAVDTSGWSKSKCT